MVDGKKYAYTKEGKAAASKARKKKMYGGRMTKKHGGLAGHDGNKHARREYKHGGEVMPKAKPC